jgi:hypothetical protein
MILGKYSFESDIFCVLTDENSSHVACFVPLGLIRHIIRNLYSVNYQIFEVNIADFALIVVADN